MTVTLAPGAKLDRDVVINFDGLTGRSFALSGPDERAEVVLASFCPDLSGPEVKPGPLRLKILVDCSGSMNGDSMEGAKEAMRRLLKQLGPLDAVSYSRFGSYVQHDMNRLTACDPEGLAVLGRLIEATVADLGGTAMNEAIISTFKDISGSEDRADLLLITDGDIWDTANTVKTALQSGQRVFAIGVSSAPAESLLRKLAEETGGACELISPRDDFEAAISRQLNRMRGQKAAEVEIDWGAEPVWRTVLPKYLYDGETLHIFAAFERPLQNTPKLKWRVNGQDHFARAGEIIVCDNPDLRRLGGRQRLEMADGQEALNLAMKYQLVSSQSSLFLIQVREAGEKAQGLPKLRQVEQMLAAGYGGLGSVLNRPNAMSYSPPPSRASRSPMPRMRIRNYEVLHYSSDCDDNPFAPPHREFPPRKFLAEFNRLALVSTDFSDLIDEMEKLGPGRGWPEVLEELVNNEGLDLPGAWAVMLYWLADKLAIALNRSARRLLRRALGEVTDTRQNALRAKIESHFLSITAENWGRLVPLEEDLPF